MPPTLQFAPLADERARIDRIVQRLHDTTDTTERADLASELVRAVARYEDIVERAVVPHMEDAVSADVIERHAEARVQLRDAMTVIHERTLHMDPRNVHSSDPDGFEQAIDEVLRSIEAHFPEEDRSIVSAIEKIDADPERREKLESDIANAAKHASERPHPPKTAIGRFVSNANVKLDHTFEDVATPHHPGADVVDGRAGRTQD